VRILPSIPGLPVFLLAFCLTGLANAQAVDASAPTADSAPLPDSPQSAADAATSSTSMPVPRQSDPPALTQQQKAEAQLRLQEHQRIIGVVPNFNVSYTKDAVPLSRGQKLRLAWHSATDPVTFGIAGFDAGLSQAEKDFPGYGQGAQGYAKRFGASYADNFDGTILGNGIFPILLKQDPRYFRRGEGSFTSRLFYSVSTTFWCKNDNGTHGPNYSNILGNLTAGGISNLYYPSTDRGAGLTFERAADVTAYGMLGGAFNEFWPDIAHKMFKNRFQNLQPHVPPPSPTDSAPPLAAASEKPTSNP
jgi:hypothetical protein